MSDEPKKPDHLPPVSTRFQKGKSGNPSGKPKGFYSIPQAMTDVLSWDIPISKALAEEGLDAPCPPGINAKRFAGIKKMLKPAHYTALAYWASSANENGANMVKCGDSLIDRTSGPIQKQIALETREAKDAVREAFDAAVAAGEIPPIEESEKGEDEEQP